MYWLCSVRADISSATMSAVGSGGGGVGTGVPSPGRSGDRGH